MSLATWKAEFYPTEAKDCPADQAIEHSLRKWRGLRAETLRTHGLKTSVGDLVDSEGKRFVMGAESCALCEQFYKATVDYEDRCAACPLAQARGGVSCDETTSEERNAPWWEWGDKYNPEPMIAALEKALADKNGSES